MRVRNAKCASTLEIFRLDFDFAPKSTRADHEETFVICTVFELPEDLAGFQKIRRECSYHAREKRSRE